MENETEKKKALILVVDDQPLNQQLFSLILSKMDYPVIYADNGQEALAKALAQGVDFIFMDILMPGMNGYEATENLRKKGFKKPIIAVTASDQSDEQERCLKAGFNDLLIKPFKKTDIEKTLEKWINAPGISSGSGDEESDASSLEKSIIFDPTVMLGNFMNNEEVVLPLLSRFIERTYNQIQNFPTLESVGDWKSARYDTHMIKGAALTMGGPELGKAAARLESACINADVEEIKTAFPLLCEAFNIYKEEAEKFIQFHK